MTMLPMTDVSWGDVPTWIAAAASSVALFFAGFAAWSTGETLRLERDRNKQREKDADRKQASRVAPIPDRITVPVRSNGGWIDFEVPAVTIRNGSDLPIYDVVLDMPRYQPSPHRELLPGRVRDGCYCLAIAPPGDTPIELHYLEIVDTLVTDKLSLYAKDGVAIDDDGEDIDAVLVEWQTLGRPSITFRDVDNRLWTRHPNGVLEEREPAHLNTQVETHE